MRTIGTDCGSLKMSAAVVSFEAQRPRLVDLLSLRLTAAKHGILDARVDLIARELSLFLAKHRDATGVGIEQTYRTAWRKGQQRATNQNVVRALTLVDYVVKRACTEAGLVFEMFEPQQLASIMGIGRFKGSDAQRRRAKKEATIHAVKMRVDGCPDKLSDDDADAITGAVAMYLYQRQVQLKIGG